MYKLDIILLHHVQNFGFIGNVGRAIVRCSSTYQAVPSQSKNKAGSHSNNGDQDDDGDDSSVDSDNPYTYKF